MPKAFMDCIKQGGRVRTTKPSAGTYLPICINHAGKSIAGEVKTTKKGK